MHLGKNMTHNFGVTTKLLRSFIRRRCRNISEIIRIIANRKTREYFTFCIEPVERNNLLIKG
jgi:hypothetical protein